MRLAPHSQPKRPLPPLRVQLSPNVSSRRGADVRLIVVHTAEGSYEGSISWLCNPAAQASSHIVVNEDGSEVTQLVRWGAKAWAQAYFNPVSIAIEAAGRLQPRWNVLGGHPVKQMRSVARIVAFLLHENGLPPKTVSRRHRFTRRGFTRHGSLYPEGGHKYCRLWKKGAGWLFFVALVKYEYARGHYRRKWGLY